MDAAACIGCGACVAMCPNASASLFMGAKIAHLGLLPQGQPERESRVVAMVAQANAELFGSCTNIGECEAVCPKDIKLEVIARMNRDFIRASWQRDSGRHFQRAAFTAAASAGRRCAGDDRPSWTTC